MGKKKIDISISFNDIVPPKKICFVPKQISYYEQVILLVKSIVLNWDASVYDYSIYIHHSRHLEDDKKDFLKSLGCNIVFDETENQKYFNRYNIYGYETDGDYTLVLDTDMMVLKTPNLELEREIYMKKTPTNPISVKQWESLYKECGLKFNPKETYHFNGGCILIKNDCKRKIYDLIHSEKHKEMLKKIESYSRHFSPQIQFSLLMKHLDWGHLNNDVNVFSTQKYDKNNVSIIHYLGKNGYTNDVIKLMDNINKKWEMEYIK